MNLNRLPAFHHHRALPNAALLIILLFQAWKTFHQFPPEVIMLKILLVLTGLILLALGCAPKSGEKTVKPVSLEAWSAPIEVRTYRGAFSRNPENRNIVLAGLAGETLSAQVVAVSTADIRALKGSLSELAGPDGAAIPASTGMVRYGGFVPVDETMELTADPLLEAASIDVPANLAQPVWLTLKVPREAKPGDYSGKLELSSASGQSASFEVSLKVLPIALPEPPDWSFYLNIWQDPSGVARAHKVKVWSEEHWKLLEDYAKNFGEHGMKSIMTSIVYDPWKSQSGYPFDTMVEWKYPGEFKAGGAGKFEWDFKVFDRYVALMIAAGVKDKIDMYALVMGPGGTTDANIRYLDTAGGNYRTAEMKAGEPLWRETWTAFLPALRTHLKEKGWFEIAALGFDEKPEKIMRLIFDFMIQTAPDFKLAASGGYPGDKRKWSEEVVIHIDDLVNPERWAAVEPLVKSMHADKQRRITWYTACMPHFPNTFLFSPLRESRLIGWLTWKHGFDGYTRWAVNAFPENVWLQPRFKWPTGDMFFVYPGPNGPLDSMRWELLRQGIQDYEVLRMAWERAEKANRQDLLEKLQTAVRRASVIDACRWIPYIEEARATVNEVLLELGSQG